MGKSGKTQRRREQETVRRRRRTRILLGVVGVLAIIAIAAGAAGLLRQRRLGEVYVDLSPLRSHDGGAPTDSVARIVAEALEAAGQSEPGQATPAPRVVGTDPGNPRNDDEEIDVRVGPASSGIIAHDPYVLAIDNRLIELPSDLTLPLFESTLLSIGPNVTPLAVAGDEPVDFASLVVYLAGEISPTASYDSLREQLFDSVVEGSETGRATGSDPERNVPGGGAGSIDTDRLVAELQPVVDLLSRWKDAQLLVFNWTDWDAAALQDAIAGERAGVYFLRRSTLKQLPWSERFHLSVHRLPTGADRRSYRQIGRALGVQPASGPRRDAAGHVSQMVRSDPVQSRIESQTPWSPVALDGSPINREHQDVVRWYSNAAAYTMIDADVAESELFRRIHAVLRQ